MPIAVDACGHQGRARCPSLPMHAVIRAEQGAHHCRCMRSSEESKVLITADACGHPRRARCSSLPMHAVIRGEQGAHHCRCMRSSEESKALITVDACGHPRRARCPSLSMHAVIRGEQGAHHCRCMRSSLRSPHRLAVVGPRSSRAGPSTPAPMLRRSSTCSHGQPTERARLFGERQTILTIFSESDLEPPQYRVWATARGIGPRARSTCSTCSKEGDSP